MRDPNQLERHQWTRTHGYANASAVESLVLCWKGNLPHGMPNTRDCVDAGSSVDLNFMQQVPIASEELSWVSRAAHEKSVSFMSVSGGTASSSTPPADAAGGSGSDKEAETSHEAKVQQQLDEAIHNDQHTLHAALQRTVSLPRAIDGHGAVVSA